MRLTTTTVVAACLLLTLAGCGDDAAEPVTAPAAPSGTPSVDPTGAPPSKARFMARFKGDPANRGLAPAFVSCFGDWVFTYTKPGTLGAYTEGRMRLEDIGGAKSLKKVGDPHAVRDLEKCTQKIRRH